MRPRPRPALAVVVAVLVAALAACQAQVQVDVAVETDGSGVVTVRIGLDPDAEARLTDPATDLRTDDLAQAGWEVVGPEAAEDGTTWWQASKGFATPAELDLVLAEVAGDGGPLRGFALVEGETGTTRTYQLTGTVDLSPGVALLSDAGLVAAAGADPVIPLVAAIEAEEGRGVAEMVDVVVTASIGDEAQVLTPRLGEPAVQVDVVEEVPKASSRLLWLAAGVAGVALVAVLLVRTRRRSLAGRR